MEDGVDGLLSEVVLAAAVEGVSLVDEQHAAHGLFDDLLGLEGGLPHIAGHKAAAIHLHQLPLGQDAQAAVDARHHARHHGLAGAGVAGEHHVQGHVGGGQVVLLPELVDLHHVDQVVYLVLDHLQADVAVQLRQQILDLLRRRQLLGLVGGAAAGLGVGGGRGVLLRVLAGGRGGRFAHAFKGRAPEVAAHAADVVLRHGADHVQLLQNDLVFFIHSSTSQRN